MRPVTPWTMSVIHGYVVNGQLSLKARDVTTADAQAIDRSWSPARVRRGIEALADPGDPGENMVSERLYTSYEAARARESAAQEI